jgi:hypothetical protein
MDKRGCPIRSQSGYLPQGILFGVFITKAERAERGISPKEDRYR